MKQLVVIGGGFAGMWAALAAARQAERAGAPLAITVLSRDDQLVIRPRLYEREPGRHRAPLGPVLDAAGVRLVHGAVAGIDAAQRRVAYLTADGAAATLGYDRLIVAAGSELRRPDVPGLREHGFNVDNLAAAVALDRHLAAVARAADAAARTVVVVGGGFTGLELVTELRSRIAAVAGADTAAAARIVLVDRNLHVAHELGANPRPVIEQALREQRVELRLGRRLEAVESAAAWISGGETIASRTVVFTGGMAASGLTAALGAPRDALGRLVTDDALRVAALPGVFAAGDAARAVATDDGQVALMSCQHSIAMGRVAGHNAASELLGTPVLAYRQPYYVTCLDLGPGGAMLSTGWERTVRLAPGPAKLVKQAIIQGIYPPRGTRRQILAAADPRQDLADVMEPLIARLRQAAPQARAA